MNAMRMVDRLRLRLRSLFHHDSVERELDEEMRFHVEELARQHVERGLTADQARAEALRQFGGVAQLQEGCRDERRTRWVEDVVSDARYAARLFAKSPGFTAVALLSLALGIGANTATFTLVETVMLRELPVHEPGALVQIVGVIPGEEGSQGSFSHPNFRWLREHAAMFSHLFTWDSRKLETGEGESMEWITVDRVSEDYFAGLGVAPILGRALADERQQPAVAVLSYGWWRRRFHADSAVLGQTIRLGGLPFTIVGVTPEGFFGPVVGSSPDVFIPLASERLLNPESEVLSSRTTVWLPLMARLGPGVSMPRAAAGLQPLWAAMIQETGPLDREGPMTRWFTKLKSQVEPASTGVPLLRRQFRQPLAVLVVVVAVVLLIACVNLSNLLLARSLTRQREIALRLAVGASRGRLLRQMLTESLLLAAAGAALGLLFGLWSSRLLASLLSTSRDTISLDIGLNLTVLAYTAFVTLLTTLLFGLAPALRALRASVHPLLKEGTLQVIGRRISSRALLVTQVALSLLLVAGATLFLRTFHSLLSVDLGFDADRVLIASVEPGRIGLKDEAASQFYRDLQDRLQVLPGAESVSFSSMTPIQNCCWWETMIVEGHTRPPGDKQDVFLNSVAPGFFRTMGTRLLRGRDFDADDAFNSRPVAIVNESFVRKFFPKSEALGRIISLPPSYELGAMEIVGIVEDARYIDLRGPTRLAAYFPLAQSRERPSSVEVLVRTPGPPLALASAVREQVHSFHPAMPVKFRSLAQEVDGVLTYERLLALLTAFFGGVALTLAAIGLYGILSYAVTRRTAEIGVRVALGASRASVLWLVMRQSLMLVIVGLAIGCTAALYLTRLVKPLLFGVKPVDPLTFAIAAGVLGTVALLASWLPARRAAAVDPVRALRYE
ncbi:MAG: FtsX-like permease family protein [Luteitalea sp.]|nr:FtsX-like permease family protein [Luteitalea sp.]